MQLGCFRIFPSQVWLPESPEVRASRIWQDDNFFTDINQKVFSNLLHQVDLVDSR